MPRQRAHSVQIVDVLPMPSTIEMAMWSPLLQPLLLAFACLPPAAATAVAIVEAQFWLWWLSCWPNHHVSSPRPQEALTQDSNSLTRCHFYRIALHWQERLNCHGES